MLPGVHFLGSALPGVFCVKDDYVAKRLILFVDDYNYCADERDYNIRS